ncbi:MAG: class I SAM-dependent methyltransferase [Methanoregulaceae archaeon]|nr:class I SAM-dependent methyltransferase [Methanoregulaceae archaeon]
MAKTGAFEALREFSASREQFLFSEFAASFNPVIRRSDLLISLLPELSQLHLGWRKENGDYIISPLPRATTLSPPVEILQRIETHLQRSVVSDNLQRLIEDYIGQKTGKEWNDPVILQRIRAAIMQQKGQYWKEGRPRKIGYRKGYAVFAYLAYHAPVYLTQFRHLLVMLTRDLLLPTQMRILDVGTGPGVVPLAITDFARDLPSFRAEIFALERSDQFLDAYRYLVQRYSEGMKSLTLHPPLEADLRDVGSLLLPTSLDLIVMQNVINEQVSESKEERAAIISTFSRLLAPGGCLLIAEPADLANSTQLRATVNAALGPELRLHSPCTCIWGGRCHSDTCWSFIEQSPVQPTRIMRALSRRDEAFRFQNTDIKYSYAVLVKDRRRRHPSNLPTRAPFTSLSALPKYTGKRVNVIGSVMSGDLGDRRTHVFLFCDGTPSRPAYAILPHHAITPDNRSLLSAPYASILELRQVLVRLNRKHQTFNLLLSRTSQARPRVPWEENYSSQ